MHITERIIQSAYPTFHNLHIITKCHKYLIFFGP